MQTTTRLATLLLAATALFTTAAPARAVPAPGQPAPDFSLTDAAGKKHSLSEYKGKFVVLEWTNPECPFVKKHYGSGNMPKIQQAAKAKGVVWLAIDSSAKGNEGYLTPDAAKAAAKKEYVNCTDLLLDADGATGRLYGAKATPHMFVIDPKGTLLYAGAIDSIPSASPDDVAKATNYVQTALDEALAGQPVKTAATKAYGCSVKY